MTKKTLLFTGLIGSIALASTFAYQGTPGETNPDCTDLERQVELQTMFENKDYESFQTLFEGRGPARKISSEEDFEKFVDMRQAYMDGDTESGDTLRKELGMGQGMWRGMKQGHGRGMRNNSRMGQGMMNGDCDGFGMRAGGRGYGRNR